MKTFVCDVVGAEELRETLTEVLPREAKNLLRRTMLDMARELRDEVRAGAPVDTGTLKKAIISQRKSGTSESIESAVTITKGRGASNDAWYWHFVEFGTVKRAARAFIIPATERFRGKLKEIFERDFFRQLERTLLRRRGIVLK